MVVCPSLAGFRDRAEVLPSTFLRVGVLAALRSKQTGAVIGREAAPCIHIHPCTCSSTSLPLSRHATSSMGLPKCEREWQGADASRAVCRGRHHGDGLAQPRAGRAAVHDHRTGIL